MKMGNAFAEARPVARHCAELIRRGPRPEERAEQIAAWRRDAARELASMLGEMFSGRKLAAKISEPEMLKGTQVFERIGPVAINCLLRCGDDDQTILLSLDHATAIAITDCSFGGEGALPEEAPAELPRSAGMLVDQVAGTIAKVLAHVNGSEDSRADVLVRSESVTRLKPFGAGDDVACFTLSLSPAPGVEWSALLAVADAGLDLVLPGFAMTRPGPARDPVSQATDGPFARMPLRLEAVLGEIDLSLGRLQSLKPGDEFPLAIPSELPLCAGEDVLARGTLGTCENRMALRLTRLGDTPAPQAGLYQPSTTKVH